MPKFIDLKIALTVKLIILGLLIFYVKHNSIRITLNQVDQHLTK
jgi:hypothetical protein